MTFVVYNEMPFYKKCGEVDLFCSGQSQGPLFTYSKGEENSLKPFQIFEKVFNDYGAKVTWLFHFLFFFCSRDIVAFII